MSWSICKCLTMTHMRTCLQSQYYIGDESSMSWNISKCLIVRLTWESAYRDESSMSWSICKCRGVTLMCEPAWSMRDCPIWLCRLCASCVVALRMLEPPPWMAAPLPVLAPSRCHSRGRTCSTTCFCLRAYTIGTKSTRETCKQWIECKYGGMCIASANTQYPWVDITSLIFSCLLRPKQLDNLLIYLRRNDGQNKTDNSTSNMIDSNCQKYHWPRHQSLE